MDKLIDIINIGTIDVAEVWRHEGEDDYEVYYRNLDYSVRGTFKDICEDIDRHEKEVK